MKHKFIIKKIGVDVCTISIPASPEEADEARKAVINYREINEDPFTIVSNNGNKVTVTFCQHKVVFGYIHGTRFTHVEIHAADLDGNNLQNLDLRAIEDIYDWIAEILGEKYGVDLLSRKKGNACFSQLELNTTFPIKHAFVAYKRTLIMLAFAFCNGRPNVTVNQLSTEELRGTLRDEGFLVSCPSYALRIYNKSKEMYEVLHGALSENSLMRVEIKYKKVQALHADGLDGPVFLMGDVSLQEAFWSRFRLWDSACQNYFGAKATYQYGLDGRNTTAANVIAKNCNDGHLIHPPEMIFSELLAYENEYKIPCLFDISYIQQALIQLQEYRILGPEVDVQALYKSFLTTLDSPQLQLAKDTFTEQIEMYTEVTSSIFSTDPPQSVVVNL